MRDDGCIRVSQMSAVYTTASTAVIFVTEIGGVRVFYDGIVSPISVGRKYTIHDGVTMPATGLQNIDSYSKTQYMIVCIPGQVACGPCSAVKPNSK